MEPTLTPGHSRVAHEMSFRSQGIIIPFARNQLYRQLLHYVAQCCYSIPPSLSHFVCGCLDRTKNSKVVVGVLLWNDLTTYEPLAR